MAETRRLLRESLRRWGVGALTDTAELLTTELVTNALQHTGGGAVLTATLTPQEEHVGTGISPGPRLRVEVHDSHPRRPGPRVVQEAAAAARAGEHGTSGRGLLLVQALADAWGVAPRGTGKVVWFELDAHAA